MAPPARARKKTSTPWQKGWKTSPEFSFSKILNLSKLGSRDNNDKNPRRSDRIKQNYKIPALNTERNTKFPAETPRDVWTLSFPSDGIFTQIWDQREITFNCPQTSAALWRESWGFPKSSPSSHPGHKLLLKHSNLLTSIVDFKFHSPYPGATSQSKAGFNPGSPENPAFPGGWKNPHLVHTKTNPKFREWATMD